MSPVAHFELVLLLLATIIVLQLAARRLRLPPAAAFVLGGIALALIPETPEVELDPDLALVLFLPPLLLSSAFFTMWRDFPANLRIIPQLAVGAVAFTTLMVGLVAHLVVPSLPWAACFALGASSRLRTQSPRRPCCKVCGCRAGSHASSLAEYLMIVVAVLLALVAGFITLQTLMKTFRVYGAVCLGWNCRWPRGGCGRLMVQVVHLMIDALGAAPPRVAPSQRGTGRRHRCISRRRRLGLHPADDDQQQTVANAADSARSPRDADAGMVGEAERAGRIAAAPAGDFERVMDTTLSLDVSLVTVIPSFPCPYGGPD
jgi:hypothetical protein